MEVWDVWGYESLGVFFVFVKLSVLKSWDLGVLEVCEGWRVGSFFCGNLGVYDS